MPVINTNVKALYTQTAMKATERASGVAMQQLSTGKRINSAKDDAAGLAIATRMTQQIRSLNQAMRNAGDAVSLMQTAEGATSEITNMLQRMRELSIQAINDTNATEQRGYLDTEFQQLKQEIVRIADTTEWNGFPILNGTSGERVGERPVYKATSAGNFSSAITYAASTITGSGSATASIASSSASITKAGLVSVTVPTTATVAVTQGDAVAEQVTLTFTALTSGQTVDLGGSVFTAGTGGATAAEIAQAYQAGSSSVGAFSGTALTSYISPVASGNTLTLTNATAGAAGSLTISAGTGTDPTSAITRVHAAAKTEVATVTFKDLLAGETVVLGGAVTFTAGTDGATASQIATAFSGGTVAGGSITTPPTVTGYTASGLSGASLTFTSTATGTMTDLAATGTRKAIATMTLPDGTKTTFQGTVASTSITFADSPLTNNSGNLVLTTSGVTLGTTLDFSVGRTFTPVAAMAANDVIINGVTIGVSYAASDNGKSPAGSAAASAIARAATINQNMADTKVAAIVNTNVMTGSAMGTGLSAATGTVTINGYTSAPINTVLNNTRESRAAVVNAINAISFQTGVVAINSNNDNQGVRLEAKDGRNIELAFNTTATTSEFEARTGLKEGLQIGSYSLETSVEGKLEVTTLSTGDWTRAGLKPASYTNNQAVINTGIRPVVTTSTDIKALGDGDLVINGVAIRATVAADDTHSNTTSATSSAAASAIAIANAINSHHADTGVTAKASSVATSGSYTTTTAVDGTYSLFINGQNVQVALLAADTDPERLTKVVNAVNGSFGQHGALATNNGTGGITLTTPDGRNLSVWTATAPSEFGLAINSTANSAAAGVTTNASANTATYTGASTLYGSVALIADPAPKQPPPGAAPSNGAPPPYVSKTFTVEAGVNGFNSSTGDFASLGFQAGTFGGDVNAADSKMTPPRTGRLSFHVGASANQTITIDLSDFGKDGPITGEITGDSDKSPATVHINDREAAKTVLAKLDRAMDKVNGTRATMGAVMNRLEHVIDNLTNVAMNSEASRSQIEDADYALASTELSRTGIMQQAATAVLAQANTSQQTVLKLLQ
jgi:flagellin